MRAALWTTLLCLAVMPSARATTFDCNKAEAPLSGGAASYADPDNDCALSFKFASGKLDVTQDGVCGMGLNVTASGTYNRVSTAPPKFDE